MTILGQTRDPPRLTLPSPDTAMANPASSTELRRAEGVMKAAACATNRVQSFLQNCRE